MESTSSLSELLHSLDATTYFFVTSGIFIGIVALVFFVLGWWFGGLLWRRYKRRCRTAETTIESLKHEIAQLKRCIAGQSARAQGSGSSLGMQETAAYEPAEEIGPVDDTPSPSLPPPAGQPFTLWTLPCEEQEAEYHPPSRAFTLWTELPAPKAVRIADFLSSAAASESEAPPPLPVNGFTAPLLFPSRPAEFPPSQAFSLWTEDGWEPAPPVLCAPSAAFTLWTSEDFEPAHVCLEWPPSAAFTLWTEEDDSTPADPETAPTAAVTPPSRDALFAATATAVRSVASRLHHGDSRVSIAFPEEQVISPSRSHAFTLWTLSSNTLPSSGISQRSALASLVRHRAEPPPLPELPPLDMEPLPAVPAAATVSESRAS